MDCIRTLTFVYRESAAGRGCNMQVPTQTIVRGKSLRTPCSRCGALELQRKPQSWIHKLSGTYRIVCSRCGSRDSEFRLTSGTLARLFFLAALAGIVYFTIKNITFRREGDGSQNPEALARTSAAGLSAFEKMMIKRPRTTMNNATILQLWHANVSPDVIVQLIRTSNPDYDLSANSVIEFRKAGVDAAIILTMIEATYQER
jgi:hypothetical protein